MERSQQDRDRRSREDTGRYAPQRENGRGEEEDEYETTRTRGIGLPPGGMPRQRESGLLRANGARGRGR
jgi:hypothetical protein